MSDRLSFSALLRRQEGVVLAVTLVLFVILLASLPGCRTFENLVSLVRNISILGILGVGLAIVVVGRGIDLSIAATMAISAAWVVKLTAAGMPEIAAIGCGLFLVITVGFLNGYLVTFAEIPPIFVTLAMALVVYGFGQFILIRTLVVNLPETASIISAFGQGKLLGIPAQLFILAAVATGGICSWPIPAGDGSPSRANGTCHGMDALALSGGRVLAASRGAHAILSIAHGEAG